MGQVRCCHHSPHPPGESGGKDAGDKGGQPLFLTLPATPRCGGEGSPLLCFRGRLREGRSLAQSHAAQQGPEPQNTGLPKVRAVTVGLCYPQ